MALRKSIRFFLNGREEECAVSPETTLLEYIRNDKELTGTKEGCGEGDCGACTVVIGEVKEGRVRYHATVSCLALVSQMDGKHVITIEGMSPADKKRLHPIQQAIVDAHATQCGFCTPGIALALLALYLENASPTPADVHRALSGDLCRCTGYVSIRRVPDFIEAVHVSHADIRLPFLDAVEARQLDMAAAQEKDDIFIEKDGQIFFSPASSESLRAFLRSHEGLKVQYVGGGSDVMVVVKKRFVHLPCLVDLTRLPETHAFEDTERTLSFGGCVPLEDLGEKTKASLPILDEVVSHMASKQVRTTATAAGNIANASPVADMSVTLMALGAVLRLNGAEGRRDLPLSELYLGYKKLAMKPGEWIEAVTVPKTAGLTVDFQKVSKRKELDISTVNSAIALEIGEDGLIRSARLCCGGVGPTTLFMPKASAFLVGKPFAEETFVEASEVVGTEATPMTDVRGSAEYRKAVMKNLVIKHFISIQARRG